MDETADEKSSADCAGAARQYSGTVGGIAMCQVAVTLTCAAPARHALIGRALYLPADWAADEERRELAGVPDEVMFATKPQLAGDLLQHAHDRGIRAGFVAGDEVYGGLDLRRSIRERGAGYVLAVRSNCMVTLSSGRCLTVKTAASLVKPGMWQRMRTGSATKGAKDYHWAMIEITPDDTPEGQDPGHAVLLLRRHRYTGTVSSYLCWTPGPRIFTHPWRSVRCGAWNVLSANRAVGMTRAGDTPAPGHQVVGDALVGPARGQQPKHIQLAAGQRWRCLAEGTPGRLNLPGRLLRILGRGTGGAERRPARWRRRRRRIPSWGCLGWPGLFRAWSIARSGSGFPWPWSSSCGMAAWLSGLASERQPAELANSDEQARGSPGRHDQQVQAGEPQPCGVRVVGDEQRVGQVADGEDLSHVRQPAGRPVALSWDITRRRR